MLTAAAEATRLDADLDSSSVALQQCPKLEVNTAKPVRRGERKSTVDEPTGVEIDHKQEIQSQCSENL